MATNKQRTVYDFPKLWEEQLPLALCAYKTSKKRSTQSTSFSLVHGTEAVVPAEIAVSSSWIALQAGVNEEERLAELEALEERKDQAKKNLKTYQSGLACAYDKLLKLQLPSSTNNVEDQLA